MRRLNILGFSLIALLLTGCTLSMDEWVETEEQKGYDEVEKVENDFFTLNYEYKKTTRSLTEEIQQYIVQVEADTILWFMDNTPADWLPKAGGQVVANCGKMFPMGLMGKVLSVERQNGLVKVVTTDAEITDCYEEFDMDLDADLFTTPPDEVEADTVDVDDTAAASRQQRFTRADADGTKQVVIRDWAMFNAISNGERQKTRASLTDIYDSDVNKEDTEESDIMILQINQDSPIAKQLFDKFGSKYLNTIDIKIYSTTKTTIKKIVKLKEKREYTRTKTTGGYKFSVLFGKDLIKAKTDAAKKAALEKVSALMKDKGLKLFSEKTSLMADKDFDGFVVEIPIPSMPFGIVIRLKPIGDFSFGIYGDFEMTIWTSCTQTTTDVKNGKKITDTNEKLKTPHNNYSFAAFGSMSLSLGGEIFIGLGKKLGRKAAGIGAFLQITGNMNVNVGPKVIGDYMLGSADECFKLSAKATVGGKILTAGLFGDLTFASKEFPFGEGYTKTYNPRLKYGSNFRNIQKEDENGEYMEQTINYRYTDFGMNANTFWTSFHDPVLFLYKSQPTEDEDYEHPDEEILANGFKQSSGIKKNKDYEFTYKNYSSKDVYIVPGVSTYSGNHTLYPAYGTTLHAREVPTIEYYVTEHLDDKWNWTGEYEYVTQLEAKLASRTPEGNLYTYKFAVPFTLRNAAYIDQYWDDWGVYYKITTPDLRVNKSRDVSLKNKITKSGKYAPYGTFSTNVNAWNTNITVEACVWVKDKNLGRLQLTNGEVSAYTYKIYKTKRTDKGDIWLYTKLLLTREGDADEEFSLEKDFTNVRFHISDLYY